MCIEKYTFLATAMGAAKPELIDNCTVSSPAMFCRTRMHASFNRPPRVATSLIALSVQT